MSSLMEVEQRTRQDWPCTRPSPSATVHIRILECISRVVGNASTKARASRLPQAHILHAVVRLPELKLGSRYFIGLVCGGQDRSLLPLRSGREY